MNKFLSEIVNNFGFDNWADFSKSFVHKEFLYITIPSVITISLIERLLGLNCMTIMAVVLLLSLELISGIWAAMRRGERLSSKKFPRFGFKAFTWFCFLFIINSFKLQYQSNNIILFETLDWFHSLLMLYVCCEYLISIDENVSIIDGSRKIGIFALLRKKISNLISVNISEKDK